MSKILPVKVGLEVHCQLNFLSTKLFCSCPINNQNTSINANTCPICRGLPGSLPDLNGDSIKKGLILGKALKMNQVKELHFTRKHYFYPDLPKSYQITQSDGVIGKDGILPIKTKLIPIKQIQLEEDPAKIIYSEDIKIIDYNRSGTPLIELVTDPVFTNESEIKQFLRQYRRLLEYLEVCDTKKEGAFRVDLNISVGKHPRVEVKNIGSDTEIINAFHYEKKRQTSEQNKPNIKMETRHWDHKLQLSLKSREKESDIDYMYLPELDIPKIQIHESFSSELTLPELPWETEARLRKFYTLSEDQIAFLCDDQKLLEEYENLYKTFRNNEYFISKFFWREYIRWYNSKNDVYRKRIKNINISELKDLLTILENDEITLNQFTKTIKLHVTKNKPLRYNKKLSQEKMSYEIVLEKIKTKYPNEWTRSYDNPNLLNYLVGQAMKISNGELRPKKILELLSERKKS